MTETTAAPAAEAPAKPLTAAQRAKANAEARRKAKEAATAAPTPPSAPNATAAETKAPRTAKPKPEPHPCACGCGELCNRTFRTGHDSRYYSMLKKVVAGKLTFEELPLSIRQDLKNVDGVKARIAVSGH